MSFNELGFDFQKVQHFEVMNQTFRSYSSQEMKTCFQHPLFQSRTVSVTCSFSRLETQLPHVYTLLPYKQPPNLESSIRNDLPTTQPRPSGLWTATVLPQVCFNFNPSDASRVKLIPSLCSTTSLAARLVLCTSGLYHGSCSLPGCPSVRGLKFGLLRSISASDTAFYSRVLGSNPGESLDFSDKCPLNKAFLPVGWPW